MLAYEALRPARTPAGASLVTLIDICDARSQRQGPSRAPDERCRPSAAGGVRGLWRYLEQPDREFDVRLGGDPQLEVGVDLLELDHVLLDFAHKFKLQRRGSEELG